MNNTLVFAFNDDVVLWSFSVVFRKAIIDIALIFIIHTLGNLMEHLIEIIKQ